MFPMIFNRVLISSSSSNVANALQFSRLNSTLQQTRAKEFQKVKLMGTIYSEPTLLKDGGKAFNVKTVMPDNNYKVHRAHVRSPKILGILGNSLELGQRVYISGDLRAMTYTNAENRSRQTFSVRVNEMYVSKINNQMQVSEEDKASLASIDQNHVSILSHIASEILHFDNYSIFTLVGHFLAKNPAEGEIEKANFYKVFVHNPVLRNMLKNGIERRDRVLVEGFLNSKAETDLQGEKRHSAYIEATHLLKVDRFSHAIDENANESIQSANE